MLCVCFCSNALNLLGLKTRGTMLAHSNGKGDNDERATKPAVEAWPAQQRHQARDRQRGIIAGTVAKWVNKQERDNTDSRRKPRNPPQ